jgi:regulator of protease activity HflC (stomatin/prohibitin superfamily)
MVAQQRLAILEKWFIPIFGVAIAVYQLALGFLLAGIVPDKVAGQTPLICAVAMVGIAFVSFLISRYATGMASENRWKPLRAGGSSLLAAALFAFLLTISLAFVQFRFNVILYAVNWIIPVALFILGLETALNSVLDIYRPKVAGRPARAAFDSRLLGIINEPGGIFRSAAAAIDYQFGFKVSDTWFYKLIERAVVPLVLFGVLTLYALSSVIVVGPQEQAIVERLGNPHDAQGHIRLLQPGIAFKWPWPIDIAYKYPVKKIMLLTIGYEPRRDPQTGSLIKEPLLWGKAHYEKEHDLLVASRSATEQDHEGAVPVSIVKANIPVHYRVRDLYKFLYNHEDPENLLESICYGELAHYGSSATIELEDEAAEYSLLGAGRSEAKRILTQRIQQAANDADLGVEIVFVGVQGIHPSADVAPDYQKVVGAVQRRQADILQAAGDRNRILSDLAGSVEHVNRLYELVEEYKQAKRTGDMDTIRKLAQRVDIAFAGAEGEIFAQLRQAQAYAFEKKTLAQARGQRFTDQLKAYNAAPDIYLKEQRLNTLEQGLQPIRKYVVVADTNAMEIFIVDLQEKLQPSLYDISGFQEGTEK